MDTRHEQATAAVDVLINALRNATNINQTFNAIGAAENILRGFIQVSTPQPSPDPEDPIDG